MARTQEWQRERRRQELPAEDRWEREQQERAEGRWPQVQAEDLEFGEERKPVVNPYAIVALVAALLLLFPVAIVFGMIAYTHPKGKSMATFALLLGFAEAAAIAGLFLMSGNALQDLVSGSESTVTTSAMASAQGSAVPQSTAAPTTAAPTTTEASAPASTTAAVRKGAGCSEAQAGLIGAGGDGGTLLCLAKSGKYEWSGPYNVGTGRFTEGEPCQPSIAKTGRSAEGRALVCEAGDDSGSWTRWTS
ncbi:hypothetical protein AB0H76_17075 [Nocardia sp. NPDC050712]|uniref:hypothetical protein n=1 Tax=Nocardia sp. NPDC050712 TaxID=3155518 RepID=UPI0033E2D7C0